MTVATNRYTNDGSGGDCNNDGDCNSGGGGDKWR
jgi:hypothetical protein